MSKALTLEQVAAYHRDGAVWPIDALTAEEVARYRGALEAFEKAEGVSLGKHPRKLRGKTHLVFPWMAELVRHPRILDAVEDVLGPDIVLFHLTTWIKEPGDGNFVPWHQDGVYFHLFPYQHVTAWVALSPSNEQTGCVRILPGSHRLGPQSHEDKPSPTNLLSNGQTLAMPVETKGAKPMVLKPGQISLHHTHVFHASDPNTGNDRRIGVGISYIPAHVMHTSPVRMTGTLVRGEDRYHHLEPEPRPNPADPAAALAFHAEAMGRFFNSHQTQAH